MSANVVYQPKFLSKTDANKLQDELLGTTRWNHVKYKSRRFNKQCMTPCLTTYLNAESLRRNKPLWDLKVRIENEYHMTFNVVLLRLYRDGNDHIAPHTDARTYLRAKDCIVASVSLGASRRFIIGKKLGEQWGPGGIDPKSTHEWRLCHGDLLIMKGDLQQTHQHWVPKEKAAGMRININFRYVIPSKKRSADEAYTKYCITGDDKDYKKKQRKYTQKTISGFFSKKINIQKT